MAANVSALLDKAKVIHGLSSDYKLALVMGVQQTSLANYRTGKTLPDARVISKICELTGDDPEILAAEIEAERAKTPEARALWRSVVERLSMTARQGVAAGVFSVAAGGALLAGFPSGNAHASPASAGVYETTHCRTFCWPKMPPSCSPFSQTVFGNRLFHAGPFGISHVLVHRHALAFFIDRH
jgi:transcriptional regulator with XRE-family HTH domain